MRCSLCREPAIYKEYCKNHFLDYFEKKVKATIKRFRLLDKKDNVLVAVSGGKDSLAVLYLLKKFGYKVSALSIDEGIKGYRDKTLITVKDFCRKNKIPSKTVSFKEHFSKSLDEILVKEGERPCTVCGIFRRYLLNMHSRGYDAIATGHNMDDEAQAVVMNIVKNNMEGLRRLGPVSGISSSGKFTKRVKPLYLCPEKEVMIFSFLNGLAAEFNECPNVEKAFRLKIRDGLNEIENMENGRKENIINWFLDYKKKSKSKNIEMSCCERCGEPSSGRICNACVYVEKIKNVR